MPKRGHEPRICRSPTFDHAVTPAFVERLFDGRVAVPTPTTPRSTPGSRTSRLELEQEQEDIEQKNKAEQEGEADASAYSGDVTVVSGLDEEPVDPIAGDTGIDAESKADADATLEQLADQNNTNSQTRPRQAHSPRRRHLRLLRLTATGAATPRLTPGSKTSTLSSSRSRRTSTRRTRPSKRVRPMPRRIPVMWRWSRRAAVR